MVKKKQLNKFQKLFIRIKQSHLVVNSKAIYIPAVTDFLIKILYMCGWSLLILLLLMLLGFKFTIVNFFSSIALYFIIQEVGDYLITLKKA